MQHASRRLAHESALHAPDHAPLHEHVFNDDVLMHPDDLAYVRQQFPHIVHLLDNPDLRAVFAKYEAEADAARDRVRVLGFATVQLGTLALLTFSTRPI